MLASLGIKVQFTLYLQRPYVQTNTGLLHGKHALYVAAFASQIENVNSFPGSTWDQLLPALAGLPAGL